MTLEATGFVARACCARAPGKKVIVTPDACDLFEEPALREVSPPHREARVAVHEGAHATVAVALGARVTSATVDGQPCVNYAAGLARAEQRVVTMAGPLGEGALYHRQIYRPPDHVLATWQSAALRCEVFGSCDDCRIALVLAASTPSLDDYIAAYRAAEQRTLALIGQPNIRGAIREIASLLMESGTLDGETIHHLAAQHGVAP